MTNLAPTTSLKSNDKPNITANMGMTSSNIENIENIVVMSGSAKRRRLEKKTEPEVKVTLENNTEESFFKLRAPFNKFHPKQIVGEKLMTKSCEILFECIRPYKDIRVTRKTEVTESIKSTGRIVTTDIIYERKATRKVQFFDFSEETQSVCQKQNLLSLLPETPSDSDFGTPENPETAEIEPERRRKTVSSEDFITKVFTDPNPMFI